MEEEVFAPGIKDGMEPDETFYNQRYLAEVEIKYTPGKRLWSLPLIQTPAEAYNIIKPCFNTCMFHHEEAWILLLNNNKPLGVARVNVGGINNTLVDVRIVLQYMLKCNAPGVILFHNHPSQNTRFSNEDVSLTRRLKTCCELMGSSLVDHIIVGEDGFRSYVDEGL